MLGILIVIVLVAGAGGAFPLLFKYIKKLIDYIKIDRKDEDKLPKD